jgi:hypothetical protein
MAQVSLAWLISRPGTSLGLVPSRDKPTYITGVTAPIVGTSSLDKLYDLLGQYLFPSLFTQVFNAVTTGALDLKLTDEEIKELSDPYEAHEPFGQD